VTLERGTTRSPDGTDIAWFRSGNSRPIVLVHGATADHTAWRTAGPLLASRHALYAIDRRGRGASTDTELYAIAREYEDVAAVVDAVAAREGIAVDVVGHSYGGRVGLGAALLTGNMRRLVSYEGAPAPAGGSFHGDPVMARLEALKAADDRAALLAYFLGEVVGMTPAELEAYRLAPSWPARVEAAPTLVREMWAEAAEEAGPERYAAIRIPVLQILGGDSGRTFTDGTWELDRRLVDGRVVVIPGARHAAHHSHPERFCAEVERFLDDTPRSTGLPSDHD
jgi:pimeloyl-ACP methyl ester carboxylesterase